MANTKQKKIVDLPETLRKQIRSGLVRFGKVKVIGLGVFETRKIPSRPGRHPVTGELLVVPSYYKVKFRPTKDIKRAIA